MHDTRPQLLELAHVLHKRNLIEIRRRRAISKVFYYKQLKRVVEAYKNSNPTIRSIEGELKWFSNKINRMVEDEEKLASLTHKLNSQYSMMASIRAQNTKPDKWMNSISGLRKNILKYETEYLKAKYDAARLTCSTRKRVLSLIKQLNVTLHYRNGSVVCITKKITPHDQWAHTEFAAMFKEFEASKAVENMLKGKYGKSKKT